LIAVVIFILGFVDVTGTIEDSKRCATTIWKLQWPKYTGCTMAAHEGLAAGLIGVAGAIWAAWLAYSAIRDQIMAERDAREQQQPQQIAERRQREANAKEAAQVCISPAIRAAAVAKADVTRLNRNPSGGEALLEAALAHLEETLGAFGIRDSAVELAAGDRVRFLDIFGRLTNLVSIGRNGHTPYDDRLRVLLSGFQALAVRLREYDPNLADEFDILFR
jgi:hypothetical protein